MSTLSKIMKLKIAITGSIGSGKSAVIEYLKTKGFNCFSCDDEYKKIFFEKNDIYKSLIKEFDILDEHKNVDFKKLSELVFNDKDKLLLLNNITHPYIKDKMFEYIDNNPIAICEVPLLFEVAWEKEFDCIICVAIDEEKRKKRLQLRGLELIMIEKILKSQLSQDYKIKNSDYVLYNNQDLNTLYKRIDEILVELKLC